MTDQNNHVEPNEELLEEVIDESAVQAEEAYESTDEETELEAGAEESSEVETGETKAEEEPEEEYTCDLNTLAQVEALLLASTKPMKIPEIADYLTEDLDHQSIKYLIEELQESYSERESGIEVASIKGQGYRIQTRPEAAPLMQRLFACRPRPLSRSAQETIAIIVYRQPVTRSEIEFIRGVDAGSIVKSLMDRGFVKCVGRKDVPGRPMLFGTTDEFLRVFGLSSIKELPNLESFQSQDEVLNQAEKAIERFDREEAGEEVPDVLEPNLEQVADDTDAKAVLDAVEVPDEVKELEAQTKRGEGLINEVLD